ncbi:hypothetical protein CXF61_09155 [Psychrobacter sp. 4Dc]|nr:hypothetical protein CXF61_09155 [Psychrobacter sp. 4Dc]
MGRNLLHSLLAIKDAVYKGTTINSPAGVKHWIESTKSCLRIQLTIIAKLPVFTTMLIHVMQITKFRWLGLDN